MCPYILLGGPLLGAAGLTACACVAYKTFQAFRSTTEAAPVATGPGATASETDPNDQDDPKPSGEGPDNDPPSTGTFIDNPDQVLGDKMWQ
jgi:hypothetical protein